MVDGVLSQYRLLYGPPDQQVSAHQKKGIWRAIAKDVRTLGVYGRRSIHCGKRWEDLRYWPRKTAEAQLGMASQRGCGACRTLTPLIARILAVAYLELDGCLGASQQQQGGVPIHGLVTSIVTGSALPNALGCSLCVSVSCTPTMVLVPPLTKCILCLFPCTPQDPGGRIHPR
ncbi:hypothetical protein NDU88_006855 [Pleurodeles waltl]|uniref:MADF domain-containing protein n=1 Tax=Pleurodeles waltl TaxID=8319 RepID=A0AAV7X2S7_PLEWA|nr:hypothetical protein NDU88_006855 [Pleurodeles waltl]